MSTEDRVDNHPGGVRPFVLFISGVTPAEITYGPLLGVVGGIKRVADDAGEESVHLVGYSAGGSAALAFAAKHPERAASLAFIEPPWIGNEGLTPEETAFWSEGDEVMALPSPEQMGRFFRLVLGPGVEPPARPPGPPPPWMSNRPAGLKALHYYFRSHALDAESLRDFRNPVYMAHGALSNPAWERIAERLGDMLPNIEVEVYEKRHHLDAPHVAEPERFARALRKLWAPTATTPVPET